MQDEVLRLASLALKSGCQGIVTSAREAPNCARNLEAILPSSLRACAPQALGMAIRCAWLLRPKRLPRERATSWSDGRSPEAADPAAAARAILRQITKPNFVSRSLARWLLCDRLSQFFG